MPELPGSRGVMVGPSGSAGALPLGGDLESAAASGESGARSRLDRLDRELTISRLAERVLGGAWRKPALGARLRQRCTAGPCAGRAHRGTARLAQSDAGSERNSGTGRERARGAHPRF